MITKNKSSILTSIKILGSISAFLLIATMIMLAYITILNDKRDAIKQSIVLYENLHKYKVCDNSMKEYLSMNSLTQVTLKQAKEIMNVSKKVLADKDLQKTLKSANIEIFEYNGHYFYAYKADADMFYFVNDEPMTPIPKYIALGTILLLMALFLLFRFIRDSMQPLQILHKNIEKFSKGEVLEEHEIKGNDEVALVANAFCEAATTIESLQKSRILFLRNIMHELKTPITKGKLIAIMLDDKIQDKTQLIEIFDNMQAQLKELSDVESISSKASELHIKKYAFIDILENVQDMLYLDENIIHHNISDQSIDVDFNLFSIALKNLVDNALKYSDNNIVKVELNEKYLLIKNKGEKISKNIDEILEPFSRDKKDLNTSGFGLGLYIVVEILKKHHFNLNYSYENGEHVFKVELN